MVWLQEHQKWSDPLKSANLQKINFCKVGTQPLAFEKAKTCTMLWRINLTENDSNEKEVSIIFGAKKGWNIIDKAN